MGEAMIQGQPQIPTAGGAEPSQAPGLSPASPNLLAALGINAHYTVLQHPMSISMRQPPVSRVYRATRLNHMQPELQSEEATRTETSSCSMAPHFPGRGVTAPVCGS
jgi:hypothetical protein